MEENIKNNEDQKKMANADPAAHETRLSLISEYIEGTRGNLIKLEKRCLNIISDITEAIVECLLSGKKILICGNGGSASDAMHIAGELVGRFRMERRALPCIALNTNAVIITAIGNDYGFENIFSRQVEALGASGDLLIGISTSGNSPNVIKALSAARDIGMKTIGMTGINGGAMLSKKLCDILLPAPSAVTSQIQEMHILCGHIFCKLAEEAIAGGQSDFQK
ncbi:MAG TPA: D-sedoheptulose 7-phosphate isomerase [Candidatus Wallbacteria bacterium]|nr:D-sedoheptulose 7-phosphate isomerase [Candidatus Wallbacteria bacterium]